MKVDSKLLQDNSIYVNFLSKLCENSALNPLGLWDWELKQTFNKQNK